MGNIKVIYETKRYVLFWDYVSHKLRLYDKLNQHLIF